jgi:protein-S-isoprenylcysteine O-methyltransferase Ste14
VNIVTYLAFATYIAIILSLIWARLRFFGAQSAHVTIWVRFYDPIVGVQILTTLYKFHSVPEKTVTAYTAWLLTLSIALSLFWWTIITARNLDFAFSKTVGKLITTGPYAVIRHPFYTSYILVWLSTSILFNSVFLWITLFYLITFYLMSARDEERVILSSEHSKQYIEYRKHVGMFLPRITKWKS